MTLNRFGQVGPVRGHLVPTDESLYSALTDATPTEMPLMDGTSYYLLTVNADAFFKQGETGVVIADPSDGSMLLPRGLPMLLDSIDGTAVSVYGVGNSHATLRRMKVTE